MPAACLKEGASRPQNTVFATRFLSIRLKAPRFGPACGTVCFRSNKKPWRGCYNKKNPKNNVVSFPNRFNCPFPRAFWAIGCFFILFASHNDTVILLAHTRFLNGLLIGLLILVLFSSSVLALVHRPAGIGECRYHPMEPGFLNDCRCCQCESGGIIDEIWRAVSGEYCYVILGVER